LKKFDDEKNLIQI